MAKVKIDCDDCCTWFISEGIWTYDESEASIVSIADAKAIVAGLSANGAKYAVIVVV